MNKKKKIYWSTTGTGKINIVFLHGWGIHSIVWKNIIFLLKPYFTLHIIDLPGFGESLDYPIMNFHKLSIYLLNQIPNKVIWLGWSMGGLIAHYLGFYYPNRTLAVIYISSSPCFLKKEKWTGTKITVLKEIKNSMILDYQNFINQFVIFHVIHGNQKNSLNINQKYLLQEKYPNPKKKSIEIGYQWLTEIDQRKKILLNKIPTLRIYGQLDNLVPIKTCQEVNYLWKNNDSYIIKHAKHAPFLSHPNVFCNILIQFVRNKNLFK